MENITVKKGDKVKAGQTLGQVSALNGISQLHFQIWKDNSPQNPIDWLRIN
jgi:murein DD-endopeptidase MepM/ murein hydrolase activator NlpD